MFIDKKLVFGWDQAVTTTADATDHIDFGAANLDPGAVTPVYFVCAITDGYDTSANTLTVSLQDSADDSSFAALITLPAVASSTFTVPKILWALPLPRGVRRYLKVTYTCSAALANGAISSFLSLHQVPYLGDWQ